MLTTEIRLDTHSGPVALNPRCLRIPAAVKYSGLSRSKLYELLSEGRVRLKITMGEEKRAFKGVWICAAIFLDERLTPAEKILLAESESLTSDDRGCYASNAHFANSRAVTESRANHIVAPVA